MSDMKVAELERAVAQVEGACQLEAIRLVQQGTATRDEADAQYARWTKAIEKAERQLRMSCIDDGKKDKWWYSKPLDTYGFDSSSSLDQVYVNNDACSPCRAFENGNPCWHRAAVRLIQHVDKERQETQRLAERERRRTRSLAQVQAAADELF